MKFSPLLLKGEMTSLSSWLLVNILWFAQASAQPPFVKVSAVADTYIDSEFPTTNYGTGFQLRVVDLAFPKEANTLIRFDISAWNQYYSNLKGAKLFLCIEIDAGFDAEVGRIQGLGTTWAETSPTWNSAASAVNKGIAGFTYNNTSTTRKWQGFDITDDVYQMLSGGYPNEGFSLKWPNASIDYVMAYYSRENADAVDPILFLAFDQTSWNNANAIATNGTLAPSAPTSNSASSVTSSSFTANWSSVSSASGYRLDVSTSNSFSSFVPGYQDLDVGNVTSQVVSGLTAGTTYYYRVRAYNTGGTSGNSATITVATTVIPPSAPTANAATNVSSSGFIANWSTSTGATGYRLDVSTSISFASFISGYQDLNVGNVTSKSVTGLTALTTYYYRLRAYNSAGTSGNSGTISVMTTLTSVEQISVDLPTMYALSQNYPNPFNPITTIEFSIPTSTFITLTIFNSLGMKIEILISQHLQPGRYRTRWTPIGIPSGVYFCELRSFEFNGTNKLLLLR